MEKNDTRINETIYTEYHFSINKTSIGNCHVNKTRKYFEL